MDRFDGTKRAFTSAPAITLLIQVPLQKFSFFKNLESMHRINFIDPAILIYDVFYLSRGDFKTILLTPVRTIIIKKLMNRFEIIWI